MMSLMLLCFFLYVPFITSQREYGNIAVEESKMIGSDAVNITQYPFLAVIQVGDSVICTASRIKSKWLVSTAKCIQNLINNKVQGKIRFGSSFSRGGGNTLDILRVLPNPDFSGFANDIGLIQVNESMDLNANSKSVDIIGEKVNIPPGASLQIFGYGSRVEPPTTIAQSAIVNVVEKSVCARAASIKNLPPHIYCAASKFIAACFGDIGGPALFRKKLAGIIANSQKCVSNIPIMLTRVVSFLPWITKTINAYDNKP